MGDFAPYWSDIDLCILTRRALRDSEVAAIEKLQADAEERFVVGGAGDWASTQLVDAVFVPPEATAAFPACSHVRAYGRRVVRDDGLPLTATQRLDLAQRGLRLVGTPVSVAAPNAGDVRADHQWILSTLEPPAARHSSIMKAGVIQEVARALVYWATGVYPGKAAALASAISKHTEFRSAFEFARAARQAGTPFVQRNEVELETLFTPFATAASPELRALMHAG